MTITDVITSSSVLGLAIDSYTEICGLAHPEWPPLSSNPSSNCLLDYCYVISVTTTAAVAVEGRHAGAQCEGLGAHGQLQVMLPMPCSYGCTCSVI